MKKSGEGVRKVLFAACWLVVWQLASILLRGKIGLPGPIETVRSMIALAGGAGFAGNVMRSFGRIVSGFVLGSAVGLALALAARRITVIGDILSPLMKVLGTLPAATLVTVLLACGGSGSYAFLICFLTALAALYTAVGDGLSAVDPKLSEMADVFRIPQASRIRYVTMPGVFPVLAQAAGSAMGLCWKCGVAAEVIAAAVGSVGAGLAEGAAKHAPEEVLAYTVAVTVLSLISEKLIVLILKVVGRANKWIDVPQETAEEA